MGSNQPYQASVEAIEIPAGAIAAEVDVAFTHLPEGIKVVPSLATLEIGKP